MRNAYNGAVCGESADYYNTTTTWTRDASTPREYYTTSCESPNRYYGVAANARKSDAGEWWGVATVADDYYFQGWMI